MADNGTARADGMLLTILELVTEGTKEVVGQQAAFDLAVGVVDKVRHTFGGELVYVCKGRTIDSIILSNQIWNDFNGNNHHELSKKYDCSVQWIYDVVRTMHKIKRSEVQKDLFDDHDEVN